VEGISLKKQLTNNSRNSFKFWLGISPVRYYCPTCEIFTWGTCPYCKKKSKRIDLEHTKWVKQGIYISIGIGILFFIFLMYDIFYIESGGNVFLGIITSIISSILIVGGLITVCYYKDSNIMTDKALEISGLPKDVVYNSTKKCNQCNQDIPKKLNKCPFCGHDQ
jgi:hypothetical protein